MDPPARPDLPQLLHSSRPDYDDDEKIKPMILNEKVNLNQHSISSKLKPPDQSLHLGATESQPVEISHGDHVDQNSCVSAEAEDHELWPKVSELDDSPPSPPSDTNIAIKQVISESSYQTELKDSRPPTSHSPSYNESNIAKMEMISRLAYQSSKQKLQSLSAEQQDSWSSSPERQNPKAKFIRESASDPNLHATEAMLDELSLSSSSPDYHSMGQMMGDPGYQLPTHDTDYRRSARLSSVAEESESFSRREFGYDGLSYMSTFSSANHAASVLSARGINQPGFGSKHTSYRHNNYNRFAYNPSSGYEPNTSVGFKSSKSAPAGTATRTGSAFGLFRRVSSETSGLKLGRRTVYRPRGPRKQKTLASTILWPLVKIKNGYVGCMMGLEGTGDLSGMAHGGSYATTARYFGDIPLSKVDSRNFG